MSGPIVLGVGGGLFGLGGGLLGIGPGAPTPPTPPAPGPSGPPATTPLYPGPPSFSDIGRFVIGYSPIQGFVYALSSPGIQNTIQARLYWEYSGDDNVQPFVTAENQISQYFLDWFNTIGLPIYTNGNIIGPLLDWVGAGLYGMPRPSIAHLLPTSFLGTYGTVPFGGAASLPVPSGPKAIPFGRDDFISPVTSYVATDDLYKRVLTWHFYKGDGKVFSARWLKRRVMRFLIGVDGTAPPIGFTPQISVVVAAGIGTITILNSIAVLSGGSIFGEFGFGTAQTFGAAEANVTSVGPSFSMAPEFQAAVESAVLELPFQYQWDVVIRG